MQSEPVDNSPDSRTEEYKQARKSAAGSLTQAGSFNRLTKRMDNRRKEIQKLPNPFHVLD